MKMFREECAAEIPKPQLLLRDKALYAVSDSGAILAVLYRFDNMTECPSAKDAIEHKGHSTSWATWDVDGQLTGLLEDIEP